MSNKNWRKIGSESVLSTKWLSVRKDAYETPSGKIIDDFYIVERGDFIVIVPETVDGSFLIVSEFRQGVESVVVNFPKGMIDPGETPEDAARRELREETKHEASSIYFLGTYHLGESFMSTRYHVFSAVGCAPLTEEVPGGDIDEIESLQKVDRVVIERLMASGEMADGQSVLAYLLAEKRRAT